MRNIPIFNPCVFILHQHTLFSTLTCELQLAQPVVNQRCVPRAGPSLVPLMLSPNLVHQPAQGCWTMQEVANHIPGQRADQVQIG